MKLYATIKSERATKSQGGNKYIEIEILNEYEDVIANVGVEMRDDEIYLETSIESETGNEKEIYSIPLPKIKGKKQKTAKRICGHCGINLGTHNDLINLPHYLLK